jgi:hypothetical protein
MQFIKNSGSAYSLTDEARSFLLSDDLANVPLGLLSAVGSYRRGKSYILNRIVDDGRSVTFKTSSTVHAETRGLWLSPKTIQNTRGQTIIVVDSEGVGSTDVTADHDRAILALVLLLSSAVIYNNSGPVTSSTLDELQLAAKIGQMLQSDAASSTVGGFTVASPQLLFLLRDFGLDLVDKQSNPISATQYVTGMLNDEMKVSMCDMFASIDAIALPRPTNSDVDLSKMTNLTPAFQSGVGQVQQHISNNVGVKNFGGVQLTGTSLVLMCDTICAALSNNTLPKIKSVWENLEDASVQQTIACVLADHARSFSSMDILPPGHYHVPIADKLLTGLDSCKIWSTIGQKRSGIMIVDLARDMERMVLEAQRANTKQWLNLVKSCIASKRELSSELLGETLFELVQMIGSGLTTSKKKCASLVSINTELGNKIATLTSVNSELEQRMQMIELDHSEGKDTLEGLNDRIQTLTADLLQANATSDQHLHDFKEASATCQELTSEIDSYKCGIKSVNIQKDELGQALEKLQISIKANEASSQRLNKESLHKSEVINSLQELVAQQKQEVIDVAAKHEESLRDLDKQLAVVTSQKQAFVARKKRKRDEEQKHQVSLAELSSKTNWLEARHNNNMENVRELRATVAKLRKDVRDKDLALLMGQKLQRA